MKESTKIERKIEARRTKQSKLEAMRNLNREEWKAHTRELKTKLERIEKPYKSKDDTLNIEIDGTRDELWGLKADLEKAKHQEKVEADMGSGDFDNETMYSLMESKGFAISSHTTQGIKLKKKLANGIQVFRDYYEFDYLRYFFMLKGKLVGYWYKRKSEHRADATYAFAWAGVKVLKKDNTIQAMLDTKHLTSDPIQLRREYSDDHPFKRKTKVSGYYGSSSIRTDPTINQFMGFVETMNTRHLQNMAIDLENPENIKMLRRNHTAHGRWV